MESQIRNTVLLNVNTVNNKNENCIDKLNTKYMNINKISEKKYLPSEFITSDTGAKNSDIVCQICFRIHQNCIRFE